jgi:PAS domain S-box-containing protein
MDTAAIILADTSGVIRFWSPGAERAFGHAATQAVGRTLDLIVPGEFRDAHWVGFRRAMQPGAAAIEGMAVEIPALQADGSTQTHAGKLTVLRAADGAPIGCMAIFS